MASDKRKQPSLDNHYGEDESAQRRDAVIRLMANTPPQPRIKKDRPSKKKKLAGGRQRREKRADE